MSENGHWWCFAVSYMASSWPFSRIRLWNATLHVLTTRATRRGMLDMLLSLHVDDDAHSHIRKKLWPGCVLGVYMYIYVGDMSMFSDILDNRVLVCSSSWQLYRTEPATPLSAKRIEIDIVWNLKHSLQGTFEIWDPSNIWSEWCPDKTQKERKMSGQFCTLVFQFVAERAEQWCS